VALEQILRRYARRRDVQRALVSAFTLCPDEVRFARALARYKPNLWLFRTHQRCFCGDFVVVDMSSPTPARRSVYVIDLKARSSLVLGGGGAGIQLKNTPWALAALSQRHRVITEDAPAERVVGSREEVLTFLVGTR